MLLIAGTGSTCADCAFNNNFVAYDRKQETILTDLGGVMILVAPLAAIAAIILNRVLKRRRLPGLSGALYFLNLGIAILGVLYGLLAVQWIIASR